MADKITFQEIFNQALKSFSEPFGGWTCLGLGVVEIVVNALRDFSRGLIHGYLDLGASIGMGLVFMVITILIVFAGHMIYAPVALLKAARQRISELEQGDHAESEDSVQSFRGWVVSKSKELLVLQSEIEFWRWKESILKVIVTTIKPEYNWNEMFEGGYQTKNFRGEIGFSQQLITIYEHALEGMRRSVTAAHLLIEVPQGKKPETPTTKIEIFRARATESIDKSKFVVSKDTFVAWKKETLRMIDDLVKPETRFDDWHHRFKKGRYLLGNAEYNPLCWHNPNVQEAIGIVVPPHVIVLVKMREEVNPTELV